VGFLRTVIGERTLAGAFSEGELTNDGGVFRCMPFEGGGEKRRIVLAREVPGVDGRSGAMVAAGMVFGR
jgi:hypothetical protein